jgi:DNA polymerase
MKELLAIRLQAASTSTSKYKTLLKGISKDGRLKGTAQFNGAGRTGRWAHRGFQPGNLPSRGLLPTLETNLGIEAMLLGIADLCFDNVMLLATSAIRGCIVAAPGKKLVISDLSNIEGRDQAWLAGEEWKLQAFRDFDAGTGPDLYKLSYSKSFGIPHTEVDKDQRQKGKVQELALGYQGRVGAFVTFSLVYGIDLDEMARDAWDKIPKEALDDSIGFYEWVLKKKMPTYGLSREVFVVCNAFAVLWRNAHAMISGLWPELEQRTIEAVENPGVTMHVGKFKIRRDGGWLRIVLPSGRALCYPQPRVDNGKLSYMGQNQYTRQWQRLKTYGGKLFENCCQAVARDVMTHNMPAIEEAGYNIVLTVHDEVVTEAPDSPEFSVEHLSSLLAANPPWALDMPLAASGFETYRYRKE